jgi:hypothetical protein
MYLQGRASWYTHLTSRLADKGYACVQYDWPGYKSLLVNVPNISEEVG